MSMPTENFVMTLMFILHNGNRLNMNTE